MFFNTYKCTLSGSGFSFEKIDLKSITIRNLLTQFEDQVAGVYMHAQKGKLGIQNLGNALRYNSEIKSLFDSISDDNEVLIKMTMNRSGFLKSYLKSIIKFSEQTVYFLVSSKDFRQRSKLFDATHPTILQIKLELSEFNEVFIPAGKSITTYFIEIIDFTSYIFDHTEGYSKIYHK